MLDLIADPVFKVFVGSTIILAMNLMVLANNTALSRARASEVINPEDKKLNPKGTVVFEEGNEKTQRYQRAHRNALENVPLFIMTSELE